MSYLSQTTGFYNGNIELTVQTDEVVIPIQTTGFYNVMSVTTIASTLKLSYPSKRQASTTGSITIALRNCIVVIPIPTTGFYNLIGIILLPVVLSCHTHPNDKLLHLSLPANRGSGVSPWGIVLFVVIPIQTIGFYNNPERGPREKNRVVIPIQTTGFYN